MVSLGNAQGGGEREGEGPPELELTVLPLRDSVLFPHATVPLTVGRPRSVRLLDALPSAEADRVIAVIAQRDPGEADPFVDDLHPVGTLGRVLKTARVSAADASYIVFVAGMRRIRVLEPLGREPYLRARVQVVDEVLPATDEAQVESLVSNVRALFSAVVAGSSGMSNDLLALSTEIHDASVLADFVAAALPGLATPVRQELLAEVNVRARLQRIADQLLKERERLAVEEEIQSELRQRVAGAQREILLREQMRIIQRELGEDEPGGDDLRRKIDESAMPPEVRTQARRELARLGQMSPGAAEHSMCHGYLDCLTALPWGRSSAGAVDVVRAERILDEDHEGLETVKERILEHLAVLQLKGNRAGERAIVGSILCFVGPPGVGKTSLGRSIARALGRAFVRISLGGIHDEAEIRGHRRTYVGALPGQIIQGLRRAGSDDPVFMLDEIEKVGRDFRGDPAAALLEVLDPEQNVAFRDHYVDLPFDLSKVLFIATANVVDPIAPPLLDRMEVLEIGGYTEEEKLAIAHRHLVPKQARAHGLEPVEQVRFADEALAEIIHHYTREAGVRGLEREIAALCRKHARRVAAGGGDGALNVSLALVRAQLGAPRYRLDGELVERTRHPGTAVALAWTPQGGDVLFVEAARVPRDRGEVTITGQVGPVMQESVRTALSWVRANGARHGVDPDAFRACDLHVHVPAGAVPKDGPSAGVVMVAALVSAFSGRPLRARVALTGEVTLGGHVLPVAGLKEKLLAARRSGVQEVVIPELNRANVYQDVPAGLRRAMVLHFVGSVDEALACALAAPALPVESHLEIGGSAELMLEY